MTRSLTDKDERKCQEVVADDHVQSTQSDTDHHRPGTEDRHRDEHELDGRRDE